MELITTLGIDWKLLLAQLVNFGLVVFVLWKFAYRPIIAMLERREQTIAKGIADAQASSRERQAIDEDRVRELTAARQQAQQVIATARADGDRLKGELRASAEADAARLLEQARQSLVKEKEELMRDAKRELAGLVQEAAEKVIGEKLDEAGDAKLIADAVDTLEPR